MSSLSGHGRRLQHVALAPGVSSSQGLSVWVCQAARLIARSGVCARRLDWLARGIHLFARRPLACGVSFGNGLPKLPTLPQQPRLRHAHTGSLLRPNMLLSSFCESPLLSRSLFLLPRAAPDTVSARLAFHRRGILSLRRGGCGERTLRLRGSEHVCCDHLTGSSFARCQYQAGSQAATTTATPLFFLLTLGPRSPESQKLCQ